MVKVDQYARIRHAHALDGMSIKALARQFHHSRRKIREILASAEPKPYVRLNPPPTLLEPFQPIIDAILAADEQCRPSSGTRQPRSIAGCATSISSRAATIACVCTSARRRGVTARPSSRSTTIRASASSATSAISMSISRTADGRCRCSWRPGRTRIAPSPSPCRVNEPRPSCTAWSRRFSSSVACRAKCGGTIPRRWCPSCSKAGSACSMNVTRRWPVTTASNRSSAGCGSRRRSHASKAACVSCSVTGPRRCRRFATSMS